MPGVNSWIRAGNRSWTVLFTTFALSCLPWCEAAEGTPPPTPPDAEKAKTPPAQPAAPAKESKEAKPTAPPLAPEPKPATGETPVIEVTATKSAKDLFETPFAANVISSSEVTDRLSIGNFVDAFKETPGVVVQKTAAGQGSPFIRGFTGFRNGIFIDGVRFNKSFFREGPNQYWATIDPLVAERIELVKGPGSVLYGSDSVGGTVNVLTRGTDTWSDKTEVGGRVYQRYAVAEASSISRVEVKGSHKDKVGFLFGASFKNYEDFRAGGGTGVVENSGFYEYGFDAKIQYRPAKHHELTFVAQYFNQDAVPRTEQTRYAKPFEGTAVGTDFRHNNDQERSLAYVKYKVDELCGIIQQAEVTLSYQNTKELLHRVRPNSTATPADANGRERRTEKNRFDVDTYGAQIQFLSKTPIGTMTYGLDWYKDVATSHRTEHRFRLAADRETKTPLPGSTGLRPHAQGIIADDSSYDLAGAYLQNEKNLFDDHLTLTAGGRFEYAQVDAGTIENLSSPAISFTNNSFSFYKNWKSVVGSLRFLVRPDLNKGNHWHVFGGVSQAFRAPSLHEITVVDSAGTFFESPSTQLEPEKYVTLEAGTKARYGGFSFTGSYYHTFVNSMVLRAPTGQRIGNQTVITKENGGHGFVKGIEMETSYTFFKDFNIWANMAWTEGDLVQFEGDATGAPPLQKLDKPFGGRLVPFTSHMGFRYAPACKNWWVEVHADAFSDADRLSVGERLDPRRIPPGGTPGFAVFGIRGSAKFFKDRLTLVGGVDNIGNANYRIHGSGQNMPGTNAYLSVRYDW